MMRAEAHKQVAVMLSQLRRLLDGERHQPLQVHYAAALHRLGSLARQIEAQDAADLREGRARRGLETAGWDVT